MLVLYGLFVAARTKINHQFSCFFQHENHDSSSIVKEWDMWKKLLVQMYQKIVPKLFV